MRPKQKKVNRKPCTLCGKNKIVSKNKKKSEYYVTRQGYIHAHCMDCHQERYVKGYRRGRGVVNRRLGRIQILVKNHRRRSFNVYIKLKDLYDDIIMALTEGRKEYLKAEQKVRDRIELYKVALKDGKMTITDSELREGL